MSQYQFWVLLIIFCGGVWLRVYHFSDWLIFQSDQSRDALIVEKAVHSGFENLPLIGPQARGSSLHLGPVFYYFQYISGKMFGAHPESFAYPDLFFGILTIPLLFFLLKRWVSTDIALGVTSMASVSLFLVTFSRFAWNPNSLQFFSTFFALCFVLAISSENRKRVLFLILAALAVGIVCQLHFVAAISLIMGIGGFLLIKKPLKVREVFLCIGIALLVQIPTIMYEIQSSGATVSAFVETVDDKGTRDSGNTFYEKMFRSYQENAAVFYLVATGQQNTRTIQTNGFSIQCDKKCEVFLPFSLMAMVFLFVLLIANFSFWKKNSDEIRKQELVFFGIWFLAFLGLSIVLAYQLSTRFFLSITPIFYLSIAIFLQWLIDKKIPFLKGVVYGVLVIFVFLNLYSTLQYFQGLDSSAYSNQESSKDLVFGTEPKVTLSQLRKMGSAVDTTFSHGKNEPIFISGESRYVRSLYYILFSEFNREGCYLKGSVDTENNLNHVAVVKNRDGIKMKERVATGTLALSFDDALEDDRTYELPSDCLDY